MGIKGLFTFVSQKAPRAVRQKPVKSFIGRSVAIDASMSLYAFMVAIRDADGVVGLTNEDGENTSHITGMLSRATKLLEAGLKPVYVFDGKPPELKAAELEQRKQAKILAGEQLKEATEAGDKELMAKLSKRTVRITPQHNADIQELFRYMGVSVVKAPGEAEAQCAFMAKEGVVYAAGTEDGDVLTFGAPRMIKSLCVSEAKQKLQPTCEIDLAILLEDLEITMDQFIDFCILCGSDYTETIRGIGPATAYNLIVKHNDIESILENIDTNRFKLPDDFRYQAARNEFKNPNTISTTESSIKAEAADYDKLKEFLVTKHSFNETKVDNSIARLKKCNAAMKQSRLDNFFTRLPCSSNKGTEKAGKTQIKGKEKKVNMGRKK